MIDRTAIRALTLDVGQTLIFPHPSLGEVYARVAAAHGVRVTPEWAEEAFQHAWRHTQASQTGLIYGRTHADALRFWQAVIGRMFAQSPLDAEVLAGLVAALYEAFSRASAWRVNQGLEPVLAACAANGIRVGILSNWDQRLRPLLDELGITPRADPVVISAEQGLEKPDPAIFRVALEGLGVPGESVLHVGDTWSDDIVGARDAGLHAAWYNPGSLARPEGPDEIIEIRELADLLPLLGER